MKKLLLTGFVTVLAFSTAHSQSDYRYSVDLNKVVNDSLTVELLVPKMQKATATFSFPKIIPGTYSISDYGKFVSNVKAFDKSGKALPVKRITDNKWRITNATTLSRVTYKVADIFDSETKHGIYPMAATNIEEGTNFVINTPGFFGYFDGYSRLPFTVSFTKPANLYASTSLKTTEHTNTRDVFKVADVDALYDAPIMYSVPDTTTVVVGNCEVLVSVYSPSKQIRSKQIAEWLSDLLNAAKQYLGGKLPADKYAFLYYFKDPQLKHSFPAGLGGALEHATSSFYYLPDVSAAAIKNTIVNTSSHEFFHIITPLTIASKEIKQFNFDTAILSKHLWLYEGITEYTAHHVQVKHGLTTMPQFLNTLSGKITTSRTRHNDTLPFTVMSKEAAGKYEKEYGNVYEKGALIGACLDIYLLHLSDGGYGLKNLTHDLGIRYGAKRYFNDDELFKEIGELTYPEVESFLREYVAGPTPIPYEYYFGLAGINFTPVTERKVFSIGGVSSVPTQRGVIVVHPQSPFNDFGLKLGYKGLDELYALNGVTLTTGNYLRVIDSIKNAMREGDLFTAKVGRKNEGGTIDTLQLSTTIFKATERQLNKLEQLTTATGKQKMVQRKWLTPESNDVANTPTANPADVSSIDAIIKASYDVISGPAGPRNWDRHHSLFLPDAKMGAVSKSPTGQSQYRAFTPEEYRKMNSPFFLQSGFYEEELKRNVNQFGNIATVESGFQYRLTPGGKIEQRGVNYFTLVNSGGRWWILNINWQDEDANNKLPASMEK